MLSLINKYLFVVSALALSFGSSLAAKDAELTQQDRVRISVRKLQPALTAPQTAVITSALVRVSEERSCGLPWQLLLSIAFQESSLRKGIVGNLNPHTKDYGLMQINAKTVLRLGLDRARLLTDVAYSLRAGCSILVKNKERYGDRPYWIGIYRAGTATWKASTVKIARDYHNTIVRRATLMGYHTAELARR